MESGGWSLMAGVWGQKSGVGVCGWESGGGSLGAGFWEQESGGGSLGAGVWGW